MAAPRPETPIEAAVLCGGASRRLGVDKAAARVGGVPLAVLVGRTARAAGAATVVGVGARPAVVAALAGEAMGAVDDRWPGAGPAAAVATALEGATAPVVVVLGCDYPSLVPATVARLIDRLVGDPSVSAVVAAAGGRVHATVGVWRTDRCSGVAVDYVRGGGRSLRGLATAVGAVVMPVDPDELVDVDTPEALAALQAGAVARTAASPGTLAVASVPSDDDPAGDHDVNADHDLPSIDIAALAALAPGAVPLVDVRQPDEYVEGHIPGARLIPLADVPDNLGEFPTDGPVHVVCRSGARSANAVAFLRASGVDAINVDGGTMAWIEAGYPVVEGGEPG